MLLGTSQRDEQSRLSPWAVRGWREIPSRQRPVSLQPGAWLLGSPSLRKQTLLPLFPREMSNRRVEETTQSGGEGDPHGVGEMPKSPPTSTGITRAAPGNHLQTTGCIWEGG